MSVTHVFKTAVVTQLVQKQTTYSRKKTTTLSLPHPNCCTTIYFEIRAVFSNNGLHFYSKLFRFSGLLGLFVFQCFLFYVSFQNFKV